MTRLRLLFALLLLATPCGALASGAPLATREVAIATGDGAGQASVAVDPREGFVVTWQEQDGSGHALRFAVVDREGRERRRGLVARGENWFVNWADFPSLAVLDNGDWVTHWLVRNGEDPHGYDIRLARSRDAGRTWETPVSPHDDGTPTQHGFVSLVPAGSDRVLVIWLDGRRGAAVGNNADAVHGDAHDHDETMAIRSVLLSRDGVPREARELDDSTCSCCQTDALRVAGRTLLAYRNRTPDEVRDIAVMQRTADGEWQAPRVLHDDGWRIEGCPVNGPAIAAAGDSVLVVWPTAAQDEMETRYVIRPAARLADGTAGPMRVLASGAQTRGRLDAAAWRRGFLVTWLGREAGVDGLQLTQLGGDGAVVAQQTLVSLSMGRISGNPRLASWRDGALVVWVEPATQTSVARLAGAIVATPDRQRGAPLR
jgi:hypothetical protein